MPKLQGIDHQRAINAFEKAGFWIARQGKHITMTDGEHVITIPRSNPINAYTMGAIIKGSGLTIEEYKKLI
ncbi:MAG: addiction module toxin, HicA family [Bacteroidetes bacterium]|nr:MAG: addiction module toxin, HicA family [Bacteroidota bacterium]